MNLYGREPPFFSKMDDDLKLFPKGRQPPFLFRRKFNLFLWSWTSWICSLALPGLGTAQPQLVVQFYNKSPYCLQCCNIVTDQSFVNLWQLWQTVDKLHKYSQNSIVTIACMYILGEKIWMFNLKSCNSSISITGQSNSY